MRTYWDVDRFSPRTWVDWGLSHRLLILPGGLTKDWLACRLTEAHSLAETMVDHTLEEFRKKTGRCFC